MYLLFCSSLRARGPDQSNFWHKPTGSLVSFVRIIVLYRLAGCGLIESRARLGITGATQFGFSGSTPFHAISQSEFFGGKSTTHPVLEPADTHLDLSVVSRFSPTFSSSSTGTSISTSCSNGNIAGDREGVITQPFKLDFSGKTSVS